MFNQFKTRAKVLKQVLVIGPSWVGDMVMAQSLFQTLHQLFPGIAIDVLAPAWSQALLARMPEVRDTITMPLGHGVLELGIRYRLGHTLRTRGYDWVLVLPNSFKSALIPWWANIPRRTGYLGELRWGLLNDVRRLDKTRLPMTVQRFVALGLDPGEPLPQELPRPALTVNPAGVESALNRLGLSYQQRLLALCPGAEYGSAKRWPVEHFAAVARVYLNQDWAVWLLGSSKDLEVTTAIAEAALGCVNLAGRTQLEEVIDLLSLATVVVSNDSGLMHIAAALDRPLVAIYGSSDPGFTPPLSPQAHILHLGLPCSPCFKRECPLGHLNCLRQLVPTQVLTQLTALTPGL
ncbi:MAG: heptosyltransferase [Pseudomonadota bacterium]|nr:heptosyltransferase [Pseudomonadota bacterium]